MARAGRRSFQPRTKGPAHNSKRINQSIRPNQTEPISETHNRIISEDGTVPVDASADGQRSVTPGPTREVDSHRATSAAPQSTQKVTPEITEWQFPLKAEPVSPPPSITPKETTPKTVNATQLSDNTAMKEMVAMLTTKNTPIDEIKTFSLDLKAQTHPTPGGTTYQPSTRPLSPSAVDSTSSLVSAAAAVTSAPVQPTPAATSMRADATTPREEINPTYASASALPHDTSPQAGTAVITSSSATTSTRTAPGVKQKYKISWEEEGGDKGHVDVDEPMQREEESSPKKPGKQSVVLFLSTFCAL